MASIEKPYNPNSAVRRRYALSVTQAVPKEIPKVERDAYEQSEFFLLQTETEFGLLVKGYTVHGNFNPGNDVFLILHQDVDNYFLKAITTRR